MEMTCSCGEMLKDGEPHCGADKTSMNCEEGKCTCATCGNVVSAEDAKCDACLEM